MTCAEQVSTTVRPSNSIARTPPVLSTNRPGFSPALIVLTVTGWPLTRAQLTPLTKNANTSLYSESTNSLYSSDANTYWIVIEVAEVVMSNSSTVAS